MTLQAYASVCASLHIYVHCRPFFVADGSERKAVEEKRRKKGGQTDNTHRTGKKRHIHKEDTNYTKLLWYTVLNVNALNRKKKNSFQRLGVPQQVQVTKYEKGGVEQERERKKERVALSLLKTELVPLLRSFVCSISARKAAWCPIDGSSRGGEL